MSDAEIFIIHGSFGSPFENWFPWASSELGRWEGVRCFVPSFPTPKGQNFENWGRVLDAYREIGILNSNSIVIGHSSGAAFALRYLYSRSLTISCFISVAGFNNFYSGDEDFDKINSEFFFEPEGLDVATLIKSSFSFYSSSDPYLPLSYLEEFASYVGGTSKSIDRGGHFNDAAGYREFPELLKALRSQL